MLAGGVPLSLNSLSLFKWKDEHAKQQTFCLGDRVCADWVKFGLAVSVDMNRLKSWGMQYHENTYHCWLEVMGHWLNTGGTDDYPTTWEGIHQLLVDVGYKKVADELNTALASPQHHY